METSQTLTVVLGGGGPYGFRLTEGSGVDKNLLTVDKVRKRGKADECGLQEGDRLVSINGRNCRGLNVPSAMELVDSAGQNLTMQVIRGGSASTVQMTSSTTVSSGGIMITAPAGVDLQQNDDQSFTMTIGMPLTFDCAVGRGNVSSNAAPAPRTNNNNVTSLNSSALNSSQQSAGNAVKQENPQRVIAPFRPPLEKVLSDASGKDTPDTPDTPGATTKNKKVFVDSAFYNDPEKRYPTVDEQISLARQVAMSVFSPANSKSRGHKMFMKRRIRAIKYTTGATEEEIAAGNEAKEDDEEAVISAPPAGAAFSRTDAGGGVGGLPASVVFASRLPTSGDKERMDAMSMDEIDRMQSAQKKMTHTNVAPQLCFSLADDLKNMKGKGGKLFAKRQAKSETWGAEEADAIAADINAAIADEKAHTEQLAKISAQHRPVSTHEGTAGGAVPVNRLKSMIDLPKPAITPWDAAAEDRGAVDRAFAHLDKDGGAESSRRAVNKGFSDNLSQVLGAPRRNPVGRSAGDTVSSLGGGDALKGEEGAMFTSKGKFQPVIFKPDAASSTRTNSSQNAPSTLHT